MGWLLSVTFFILYLQTPYRSELIIASSIFSVAGAISSGLSAISRKSE